MKVGGFLPLFALLACSNYPPERSEPAPPRPVTHLPPAIVAEPSPPPRRRSADWTRGFGKCAPCNTIEKNGPGGLGPNLYGVFGRPAATSQPDYAYSSPLRQSGLVWDRETLDRWLAGPREVVPGTKMAFRGLGIAEDRKAVIAVLEQWSDSRP